MYPVLCGTYSAPTKQFKEPFHSSQDPLFSIQFPVPSIQYQVTSTQYPVLCTKYPVPNIQYWDGVGPSPFYVEWLADQGLVLVMVVMVMVVVGGIYFLRPDSQYQVLQHKVTSTQCPVPPWSLSDYRMITLCLCQGGSTIAIHCSDAKKRVSNI